MTKYDMQIARHRMVERHLRPNGISDPNILSAFMSVPRHRFVSLRQQPQAYQNQPLRIGFRQVTLPPLVLAQALQALNLRGHERILEVGTGSGYLTALLMALGQYVFSLERIPQIAEDAAGRLQQMNYENVDLHIGDGSQGLPDMATFDVIVITAHVAKIPKPIALQLQPQNGRMLIPVGNDHQQNLKIVRRDNDRWYARTITPVNLPGLVGRYGAVPPSAFV